MTIIHHHFVCSVLNFKSLTIIILGFLGGLALLWLHWLSAGGAPNLHDAYLIVKQKVEVLASSSLFKDLGPYSPNYSITKQVIDTVSGLISLLYCSLIAFLLYRANRPLRTPKSKISFFVYLNIALVSLIPALFYELFYKFERYDFPADADSMGIPMFGILLMASIWLPLFNLLLYFFLMKAPDLPLNLFSRPSRYTWLTVALEIFFGFIGLKMLLVVFPGMVLSGEVAVIPCLMLLLYLLLSVRSVNIHRSATEQPGTSVTPL